MTRSTLAAVGVGAAALVASLTGTPATSAAFTDSAVATSGALTSTTVPAPVVTCGTLAVGSARINWTAVAGATGYRVHSGANGATVTTVGPGVTSQTYTGLISGGTFWVEALRDFGTVQWESVSSNTASYSVLLLVVALCSA